MAAVTIIAMLALVQYLYFGVEVGRARGRTGVQAPAVTGDPEFERVFRAHYNTLEQLIVFLPAVYAAGYFVHELYALSAGFAFLVGRTLYFRTYVADAAKRGPGMIITMLANLVLVLGALTGAVLAAF
ncbi:MAG: MAPEG family protein [Pseudomonadales bacterium]